MYGLIMLKEYMDEILSEKKSYDARAYDTNIRGKIGLVESRTSKLVAIVDLISTHQITAKEYEDWHKTGKWKNLEFSAEPNKVYYAYELRNPVILVEAVRVAKTSHSWCRFDDGLLKESSIKNSLF